MLVPEAGKTEYPVLAVDVGGTKILAALVSSTGEVLARRRQPTMASAGPDAVIQDIFKAVDILLAENKTEISGIGLAVAGLIDSEKGIVTTSPNLPGWEDVPLKAAFSQKYGVPTLLVNDASAAAWGEYCLGAGWGFKNLVYLTVSTGIGGGLVLDGQLYLGSGGAAGELGHMIIDKNGPQDACGNLGCLESLASGKAIAGEAIKRLENGETSTLRQMAGGDIKSITAREVAEAASEGDSLSLDVTRQAAVNLGLGLVNIVNIFNPDVIAIGGGVSNMGELLLEPARQLVAERAFILPARAVRVVPAKLGEDAGIIGVALLTQEGKGTEE